MRRPATQLGRLGRDARSGMTLIEILVVVSIMVFLLGLTVASIKKLQTSHEKGETMSRLHALARALQMYREDWGDVPPWDPTQPNSAARGNGLYTLLELDLLSLPRFLNDSASPIHAPWVLNAGAQRLSGLGADDNAGLLAAYNGYYGGSLTSLTPAQQHQAYWVFSQPAAHAAPATTPASFAAYDEEANENFCSWMMQDPFTREWKYQPQRVSGSWAAGVGDPSQPDYYHRQLSRVGTDENTARYLPASDTVVTWSTLFRTTSNVDIVLFADGHAALEPVPTSGGGSWGPERAGLRDVLP